MGTFTLIPGVGYQFTHTHFPINDDNDDLVVIWSQILLLNPPLMTSQRGYYLDATLPREHVTKLMETTR